ncbi:MAG: hypothetical protein K2Y22_16380 [Candidatus Obscuribacterales bacterium]|nr:hypothetical protein [Candidatus Obscuribacterales bacterium]
MGEHKGAVEDFGKAIQLSPDLKTAHRYRAESYLMLGQPISALKDFFESLTAKSQRAVTLDCLVLFLLVLCLKLLASRSKT